MADLGEGLLQTCQEFRLCPAGEHLGNETASRRKNFLGKTGSRFAQRHDAEMIGRTVSRGRGGHVREHNINPPGQKVFQALFRSVRQEIKLKDLGTGNRINWREIDPNHSAACSLPHGSVRIGPRHRNLEPATRRAAQIDNLCARDKDPEPVVDFLQLVGSTASQAVGAGPRDVWVVELPLQPAR